jgi:NADPH-dependent 2,4-dienoyl-CoA reductase/sulfur reductase-like enzyme
MTATVARPALSACLELLKPVTWFAPMWAFSCGVVSSGLGGNGRWHLIVAGILLTGPLVCGTSQVTNEPNRPIPSGRIPDDWGFQTWDVVIVGGGPSGATVAHDLACSGRQVALLDKAGRIKP